MKKKDKLKPDILSGIIRRRVIIIFGFFATFNAVFFGIQAMLSGDQLLFIIDAIMLAFSLALVVWTVSAKSLTYQPYFCIGINQLFFLYLFAFGGIDKTGFLWSILVPVTVFYLAGLKKGAFLSFGYFGAVLILIFADSQFPGVFQIAGRDFLVRGLIIYCMTCVILCAYEYSHILNHRMVRDEIEKRILAQEEVQKTRLLLELASSKEKYQILFDHMQEGFTLLEVQVDEEDHPRDLRYLDVNMAYEAITHLKKEDITGKSVFSLDKENEIEKSLVRQLFHAAETKTAFQYELHAKNEGRWYLVHIFIPQTGQCAVILSDITKLKNLQKSLMDEKERLKTTLHSMGEGVLSVDGSRRVVLMNESAEKLTGWTHEAAFGRLVDEVFRLEGLNSEDYEDPAAKALGSGQCINLHDGARLITKDGTLIPVAYHAAPILGESKTAEGAVLVFRDIGQEKKKEQEILYLSYRDVLTGLHNRRYFEEAIRELERTNPLPVSILIGDLNGLKLINDVFGHLEGDRLLKKSAGIIQEACGPEAILARWGGDEFIALLPGTGDKEAEAIYKSIKASCDLMLGESHLNPSISMGYATKTEASQSLIQTLKTAEDYMYRRKLLESTSLRSAVVSSIKNTLYERSHETEEHAERLKQLCSSMGTYMGLSDNELNELELFAVLHDVGKIAIRDSILNKPGKLNEEEWREMVRHPEIGYRIAQSSPELAHIADYILTHHEKWDGSGYPQGLKGEGIPLLSRIVALADAYDAMVSDRPYRKALDENVAVEEIIRNAGTQFDPDIARIFVCKVLKKEWS